MPSNDPAIAAFDRRPDCPALELIAAYVEGRRLWGRRRRLEAHFADCDRCFSLLAEVTAFRDAEPDDAATLEDAPLRSSGGARWQPRLLWAGGGLVAAALAIVIGVIALLPRAPAGPSLDRLMAAVGDQRVTEARLAGFAYGRSPDVLRGSEPDAPATGGRRLPLAAEAVVAEIQEQGAQAQTAEAIHARGVSRIFGGEVDGAIEDLQRAVTLDPQNARFLSDLSAALVTRGTRQHDSLDFQQAFDRANQAIERDGRLPEAWFNRALALEKLTDPARARQAWREYLKVDGASPWAEEARRRLEP